MDYEKKYKEALERMKRWAEGTLMPPDESPKTLCTIIFPELAESEDERIRKWLIKEMHRFHDVAIREKCQEDIDKTEAALAWLEKQKEQKPAEWSEEDENVIETLIRELRLNAQFEFAVRKLGLDYIQTLTVLDKCRRLCPQSSWKPSEEQMEAIKHAYNSFPDYCPTKLGLKSLYEHLKKL